MHPVLTFGVEIAIFEGIIVLMLMAIIGSASIVLIYQAFKEHLIFKKLDKIFLKAILKNKKINFLQIPKRFWQVKIFLQLIQKYDEQYNTPEWHIIRKELLLKFLLPMARKQIQSYILKEKIYASAVFVLLSEQQDQTLLNNLLHTSNSLIFLNSCFAGIKFGFKNQIWKFIEKLANTSWLYRTSYIYIFHGAPNITYLYVKELLYVANSKRILATCYDALSQFPAQLIKINQEHLYDKDINLRISAVNFYSYINKKAAIPILIQLLESDSEVLKLVSIHKLYTLRVQDAQKALIKCLSDTNLSVQLSAAKALLSLNPAAKKLIHKAAPDINLDFAELPYVANMDW